MKQLQEHVVTRKVHNEEGKDYSEVVTKDVYTEVEKQSHTEGTSLKTAIWALLFFIVVLILIVLGTHF